MGRCAGRSSAIQRGARLAQESIVVSNIPRQAFLEDMKQFPGVAGIPAVLLQPLNPLMLPRDVLFVVRDALQGFGQLSL